MMKKILLLIGLLILLPSVSAFDFERNIATDQLPFELEQPISIEITEQDINIYFNSTTEWITVPDSIYIYDESIIYVNATILIPENTSEGEYEESIFVTSEDSITEFTLYFKITDTEEENINYNRTNLKVQFQDILTNNNIVNLTLKLTDGVREYTGYTNENGEYTFINVEMKKWLLYYSGEEYPTDSFVIYLNEQNEFHRYQLLNSSANLNNLGSNQLTEILFILFSQNSNEETQAEDFHQTIFINNTIFEYVPMNRDAYYEMLECNPENLKQLNTEINSWRNQSNTNLYLLEKQINESKQLQNYLTICKEELNDKSDDKLNTFLLIMAIELGLIIGGAIIYFVYQKYLEYNGV